MNALWIGLGVFGALVLAAAATAAAWLRPSRTTSLHGLFGAEPEHINVRSADNVRLLSDDQLRALERALDQPDED